MRPHLGREAIPSEAETRQPLRVAVLATSPHLAAWQARCLRALLDLEGSSVTLLNWNPPAPKEKRRAIPSGSLWSLVCRCILRPVALRPVDLSSELADVLTLSGSEDDIEHLRQRRFDFILSFLDEPADHRAFADVARHGLWFFSSQASTVESGRLLGFWERYGSAPVIRTEFCRLTGQRADVQTLVQGVFPLVAHSHAATVDAILFEMARWPQQMCRRLLEGSPLPILPKNSADVPVSQKTPNALQVLLFLVGIFWSGVAFLYRYLFRHARWSVGVVEQPIQNIFAGKPLTDVHWLEDLSRDGFAADPFALVRPDGLTILYEDFPYAAWKGRISAAHLVDGQRLASSSVVFDFPFHMSYPYVFEHEGEIYCVPETWHANEVVLYKALDFPHRWQRYATLLNGIDACDSTIIHYQGRWWLFCTCHRENANLKLFIWHADELNGPWQPHAANPVKIDITSARPAGTPFVHEGILYRPAQDCSRSYGGRITLNRVSLLNPVEFAEEPLLVLEPPAGNYPAGLHTIAVAGRFFVVDGLQYKFNWAAFRTILGRQLRRLRQRGPRPSEAKPRQDSLPEYEAVTSRGT